MNRNKPSLSRFIHKIPIKLGEMCKSYSIMVDFRINYLGFAQ